MDTKRFLSLSNELSKGIIPTQCMTQRLREATDLIQNNIGNNVIISEDQVHDLERSCHILQNYLKASPGRFVLADSVAKLVDALEKRYLATDSIVKDANFKSSIDLIRWK